MSVELVGVAEIADKYNVNRSAVSNWAKRYGDFPVPLACLKMGPVWDWATVEAWVRGQWPFDLASPRCSQ
jgi:chromosome partitioning protein